MSRTTRLLPIAALLIFITSCKDKIDYEAFSTEVRNTFSKNDSTQAPSRKNEGATVYQIYKKNNFQPVWLSEKGDADKAKELVKELNELSLHGITSSRYKVEELNNSIKSIEDNKDQVDIANAIKADKQFTVAYIQAANDLMYGVLNPERVVDMWYHDNDTAMNIADNFSGNSYPKLSIYESKLPAYKALIDYKKDKGENLTDSMATTINANLERLRWLPQELEDDYVVVIVPKMELYLVEGGKVTMNMRTVVGKVSTETPSLNADMENVVFNPSWGIPPGIMKRSIVPGLMSKGEDYIKQKGYKVYDRQGNEVAASEINEDNYENYIVRQPPSEKNALGQVKFNLPNPYAIYLHDTPHRSDFEKDERAKSSGCIRLHHPRELADHILTEMSNKDYSMDEINEIVSHNKTEYVNLKHRLPVHILYLTAYKIDGGDLEFYNDIYNRDAEIAQLLR